MNNKKLIIKTIKKHLKKHELKHGVKDGVSEEEKVNSIISGLYGYVEYKSNFEKLKKGPIINPFYDKILADLNRQSLRVVK